MIKLQNLSTWASLASYWEMETSESLVGDDYMPPELANFQMQVKKESACISDSAACGAQVSLRFSAPFSPPFDAYRDSSKAFGLTSSMDTPAVEKLIMEQIQHDINSCARSLGIATNPEYWSATDSRKWLTWMLDAHRLPGIADVFAFDGLSLCSLSEEELTLLCGSPEIGSKVAAQLEVWKNACKIHSQASFTFFPGLCDGVRQSPCEMGSTDHGSLSATSDFPHSAGLGLPSPCLSPHSSCSDVSQSSFDASSFDESSQDCTPGQSSPRLGRQPVHLWDFLKELLLLGEEDCIQWLDRQAGVFKIVDSARVAKLWGLRKNRPAMNYDKLSRSIRQYYKKGIIKKTAQSKRLVYQFCEPYLSR